MKLTYAIKFVADLDRALAFHRETLGLALRYAAIAAGPLHRQ